jgi:hypothetical protein
MVRCWPVPIELSGRRLARYARSLRPFWFYTGRLADQPRTQIDWYRLLASSRPLDGPYDWSLALCRRNPEARRRDRTGGLAPIVDAYVREADPDSHDTLVALLSGVLARSGGAAGWDALIAMPDEPGSRPRGTPTRLLAGARDLLPLPLLADVWIWHTTRPWAPASSRVDLPPLEAVGVREKRVLLVGLEEASGPARLGPAEALWNAGVRRLGCFVFAGWSGSVPGVP